MVFRGLPHFWSGLLETIEYPDLDPYSKFDHIIEKTPFCKQDQGNKIGPIVVVGYLTATHC
jgi:hypothetical protein